MHPCTLIVVLTPAALACTSTPSLAQAGPEPAASFQGLEEEPGFIMDSLVIPEGFTAENISGYYLEHDLATDTWSATFVFESDFTEQGYADGGGSTYDSGGGISGREISGSSFSNSGGGSVLDDGVILKAGRQIATSRTKVTKTTSSSWSVKWVGGFIPVITYNSGSVETTVTETTTTTRTGRLTNGGESGRLPPP